MKFFRYLKDKIVYILINSISIIIIICFLLLAGVNEMLIIFLIILLVINFLLPVIYEFIKKKLFYNSFQKTLDNLDKKYLITEMIDNSDCLDGKLLLEYLYEINKAMHEEINNYKQLSNELKEYIELWCHEIKTPIATSKLIIENNNNEITKSILEEIDSIENYVEQVLYYSKSDMVENDYIIASINLKSVIDNVIKRNKKALISKKIKIVIEDLDRVKSDAKWLEFILNQIIANSIKYSKQKKGLIIISSKRNKNNTVLSIEDNGIGIEDSDIDKVFEKGFTGKNGHKNHNSTGIGLYLCNKLCKKLGHSINIKSELNNYTIVNIIFPNSSMTNN